MINSDINNFRDVTTFIEI